MTTTAELYGVDTPRLTKHEGLWLCRSRDFFAYGTRPEFAYVYWEREVRQGSDQLADLLEEVRREEL